MIDTCCICEYDINIELMQKCCICGSWICEDCENFYFCTDVVNKWVKNKYYHFSDGEHDDECNDECNDEVIYELIKSYFKAVDICLWKNAKPNSFITKTVGIQALFDLCRKLILKNVTDRDLRVSTFAKTLCNAEGIDFSDSFFHASGSSRIAIRKTLEYALGIRKLTTDEVDHQIYRRLLKR